MSDTPETIESPRAPMAPADAPSTRLGVMMVLLSQTSTKVILVSGIPLVVVRLWLGGWSWSDLWAALVVAVLWPGFEWLLHKGLHLAPFCVGSIRIDPKVCQSHRRHHVRPGVVDDILLPPAFLFALAGVAWLKLPAVFGWRIGLTAAAVFHIGGFLNGWVHLLTHSRVRPASRYYAWVRRNHHLHHFKEHRRWFAFTGPWLDGLSRKS